MGIVLPDRRHEGCAPAFGLPGFAERWAGDQSTFPAQSVTPCEAPVFRVRAPAVKVS